MRRKSKQAMRSFLYMGVGLAMLFYAIPQLPDLTWSLKGAFSIVWLLFAFLIIGANLYYLIGVDKERKLRELRQKEWDRAVTKMAARLQYERRRRRMLSR